MEIMATRKQMEAEETPRERYTIKVPPLVTMLVETVNLRRPGVTEEADF